MGPSGRKASNMLLRKSGGQGQVASVLMKWLGQSQKDVQLQMCLEVKGKSNCANKKYCPGNRNVGSLNLGKLDVVKQEMARINILGVSEIKWMGMDEFNSDDYHIYYCGQESHRRNGVALIVHKRVGKVVLGYNLKNDRMISIRIQGRPLNITANPRLWTNHQC